MATIHNIYASMSNAMAPEITFLNDYEIDETDISDSDSLLIECSNVKSDSSEYQNNHWANYLVAPQESETSVGNNKESTFDVD